MGRACERTTHSRVRGLLKSAMAVQLWMHRRSLSKVMPRKSRRLIHAIRPSPSSTSPASPSTYSAPAPTYKPITSCPQANNTIYTSSFANGRSGSASNAANLSFIQYCNLESPLENISAASTLLEAFVYSLGDCVEACAALNYWAGDRNCSVAVYDAEGSRPGNCWVGHAEDVKIRDLGKKDGLAIAVLRD